jgi:hypothetical protein
MLQSLCLWSWYEAFKIYLSVIYRIRIFSVVNEFVDFSVNVKKFPVSRCSITLVRGITTDLKFPLAGFATMSITADFLYPVIWKAIRILETSIVNLKVLFITCDNRFCTFIQSKNRFITRKKIYGFWDIVPIQHFQCVCNSETQHLCSHVAISCGFDQVWYHSWLSLLCNLESHSYFGN